MSKRDAIEKEPSTLEKDRENQSKYYLSYPKRPVLDRKWENRDVNVQKWANIPKFCKLNGILTHLRFLKLFFDDALVDMIDGYTKLYSRREKEGISFELVMKKVTYSKHAIA